MKEQKKELKIPLIKNGTVIDHITAGNAVKVLINYSSIFYKRDFEFFFHSLPPKTNERSAILTGTPLKACLK